MKITLLRAYLPNTNHEIEIYNDSGKLYLAMMGVDRCDPVLITRKDVDGFISGVKYTLEKFTRYIVC